MSAILDALRKSEQERNQNKVPTLNDMAAPSEPSKWPLLLSIAVVLLAIALAALAYVIWNKGEPANETAPQNVSTAASSQASSVAQLSGIETKDIASAEVKQLTAVNIVSYSENPELRFAMVNGKMVREGEFIQPGLKVDQIRADSVVFNLRGETLERSP